MFQVYHICDIYQQIYGKLPPRKLHNTMGIYFIETHDSCSCKNLAQLAILLFTQIPFQFMIF